MVPALARGKFHTIRSDRSQEGFLDLEHILRVGALPHFGVTQPDGPRRCHSALGLVSSLQEMDRQAKLRCMITVSNHKSSFPDLPLNLFYTAVGIPAYHRFLDFLGQRITLKGWDKHKAGLDVKRAHLQLFLPKKLTTFIL